MQTPLRLRILDHVPTKQKHGQMKKKTKMRNDIEYMLYSGKSDETEQQQLIAEMGNSLNVLCAIN